MTVLDLGSLPTVALSPLPTDLQGAVVSLPFHAVCPWCGVRPAGLLAGHCGDPVCRTAYLDADREFERAADQ
ncbi:hypothetical protein O7626_39745 [Micromonospora sp. WMMD1102]|uniref:hypothetical protein n=1 Tax=Micromonospora sp. WMMD1102 TaxID=3016105 RepID=UPI002415531D|nr:hypothetical protein [Micromonospora sp. WMMD1102]MDG4791949.1 hypothetical protein [Micromonospora sp. WMMD1102]